MGVAVADAPSSFSRTSHVDRPMVIERHVRLPGRNIGQKARHSPQQTSAPGSLRLRPFACSIGPSTKLFGLPTRVRRVLSVSVTAVAVGSANLFAACEGNPTSATFDRTSPPTTLAIVAQPSSAVASGSVFEQQPSVRLQ